MTTCPACSAPIEDTQSQCSRCGHSLDLSSLVTETGLDDDSPTETTPRPPSQSGSSAIGVTSGLQGSGDEYSPGTILAGRYRVIGLLGRGGMGSVYRADDLTLGQPVALKFLPVEFSKNNSRLERFRDEVRVSRQVSHPNVCRVHDIGEYDGRVFLSMELVDGGDLASLLKRIGRLPTDRGLDIARQLCAGLAAAHKKGVLHRDLKPANVMIDSEGHVRIADFGLASLVGGIEGHAIRSGTPAYMAPETLRGESVSEASDIYALGLVLYELFTGKRAFRGSSVPELVEMHTKTQPQAPSSIVPDLDPQIERTLLLCLEKDPAARPSSALGVSLMLPGGDPLAEALAAGETPAPELVAQSGEEGRLGVTHAWFLLAGLAVSLIVFSISAYNGHVLDHVPLSRPPAVQLDRNLETLDKLGIEVPEADRKSGFGINRRVQRQLSAGGLSETELSALESGKLGLILFWLRTSPEQLVAETMSGRVTPNRPPRDHPGEVYASFNSLGHLQALEVVPQERLAASPATTTITNQEIFAAAGLDLDAFNSAEPLFSPPQYVDDIHAFVRSDGDQDFAINRIEIGFSGGALTSLRTADQSQPAERPNPQTSNLRAAQAINTALIVTVMFVGAWLARRNVIKGRGDLRGSWRLSGAIFVVGMAAWLLSADHALGTGQELDLFVLASGRALFMAAFVWLLYLTLEPEVRRHWPRRLIAWQRLLAKTYHDPLVGSHILIGLTLGCALTAMVTLVTVLSRHFIPGSSQLETNGISMISSSSLVLAGVLRQVEQGIFAGLFITVLLLLVRLALRRTWAATVFCILLFAAMNSLQSDSPYLTGGMSALILGIMILVLLRYGLLSLIALVFAVNLGQNMPLCPAFGTWYFQATMIPLLTLLGAGILAFRVATAHSST